MLEGGKPNRELNESQRRIACNIAPIIQFNAVKQTRKETTVKFRHSRENKPPLPDEEKSIDSRFIYERIIHQLRSRHGYSLTISTKSQ